MDEKQAVVLVQRGRQLYIVADGDLSKMEKFLPEYKVICGGLLCGLVVVSREEITYLLQHPEQVHTTLYGGFIEQQSNY